MTEYIDLDTPLEVYVARGGFCAKRISTLRELLDTNKIKYKVADVVTRDCFDRLLAENDELRAVRPVVRGEWKYRGQKVIDDLFPTYACSVCHCVIPADWRKKCNFCPNCGAMMEES